MVQNLRMRRRRLGLSQAALARQLYVDRLSISAWENGRAKPALPGLVEEKLARLEAEQGLESATPASRG